MKEEGGSRSGIGGWPKQYDRWRRGLRTIAMAVMLVLAVINMWRGYLAWGMAEAKNHLLMGGVACAAVVLALRYGYLRRGGHPVHAPGETD